MAIKMTGHTWCPVADDFRSEFVMDSAYEVKNLPKCCYGSTAIAVDGSGKIFMVNASGQWSEL